jgi:hypothetical protein
VAEAATAAARVERQTAAVEGVGEHPLRRRIEFMVRAVV